MPPSVTPSSRFSALRARSYVLRLPLFTRVIVAVIVLVWAVGTQSVWDVRAWGALVPEGFGLKSRK
jgi:GPI-anchor transamidase subunit GAA1